MKLLPKNKFIFLGLQNEGKNGNPSLLDEEDVRTGTKISTVIEAQNEECQCSDNCQQTSFQSNPLDRHIKKGWLEYNKLSFILVLQFQVFGFENFFISEILLYSL